MGEAFDRGRSFERKVAALLRKKLGARVERDRRSGAGINKSDISDYYREIPLHMEIKDQETLKVKEWFRQAEAAASFTQAPAVIFAMEEEILACVRFTDLVNFLVEIADLKAEVDDLRKPMPVFSPPNPTAVLDARGVQMDDNKPTVGKIVQQQIDRGSKTCKNGHLCDDYGFCMQKGCPYSRGYKKPKGKKK